VIVPWKETVAVEQRIRFVMQVLEGTESFAQLCRAYGVSRRVGYKWVARYRVAGVAGLGDRSRAPRVHRNEVPAAMRERIVRLRGAHARWGPRKLAAVLRRDGVAGVPAASTIGAILRRDGLSVPRKRVRRAAPQADALGGCHASNRVWCADFKGWFRTGDGARCDPLTISDGYSRYLLRCQAVAATSGPCVKRVFEATFREYGLPEAIRTDNGPPFASVGVAGLSRLGVWWVRLGIALQRIEPGKPQQNGRHERMHLTLKQETASPPSSGGRRQQARFDAFRREFNEDRPHEALGMNTPASCYAASARQFPERLAELEYPAGHALRRVAERGQFRWKGEKVMLGKALDGEVIGLEGLGDRYWHVWFGPLKLGAFDGHEHRMLSESERRRRGL
jgi:transposase InsO family protein